MKSPEMIQSFSNTRNNEYPTRLYNSIRSGSEAKNQTLETSTTDDLYDADDSLGSTVQNHYGA